MPRVEGVWSAFMAQINKIANIFWEADPIAQMQYEYDKAVELKVPILTGAEAFTVLLEQGPEAAAEAAQRA